MTNQQKKQFDDNKSTPAKVIYKKLNIALEPAQWYRHFLNDEIGFYLDSGINPKNLGRYSYIGKSPFLLLQCKDNSANLQWLNGEQHLEMRGDPFMIFKETVAKFTVNTSAELPPFCAGGIGYFSYDLGRKVEVIPQLAVNDSNYPDLYFAFYDTIIAYDHLTAETFILSTGLPACDEINQQKRATERLQYFEQQLKDAIAKSNDIDTCAVKTEVLPKVKLKGNFTKQEYLEAVSKVKEYIAAGDIFQANLSQRFTTQLNMSAIELYDRLRAFSPAPFAAYLNFGELQIASSSPERFLKMDGSYVETRPIKGTRPRGKTIEEDLKFKNELAQSIKDAAEHIMIVDLERNDLGRVCEYGTVKVSEMASVEEYANVFHIVSTVDGILKEGKDQFDCLRACYPGGSITGAPKVRAMEIIEELEPHRRGVYTGAIGYWGFNEKVDLNIAIRTFIIQNNRVYFQVGGGIVADSEPEAEYDETIVKAQGLFQALGLTENNEDDTNE